MFAVAVCLLMSQMTALHASKTFLTGLHSYVSQMTCVYESIDFILGHTLVHRAVLLWPRNSKSREPQLKLPVRSVIALPCFLLQSNARLGKYVNLTYFWRVGIYT